MDERFARAAVASHVTVSDRILIIEDDARLAAMVSEYLGESGFAPPCRHRGARGSPHSKRGTVRRARSST